MTHYIGSVPELFEALGRNPNELVGLRESDWLDFKLGPYQLDDERHRAALAKDVTAFANSDQGVIVIGVGTRIDTEQQTEVATDLRPVAAGLVDPQQIQAIIHEWVYPALDVSIASHAAPPQPGQLWTIHVERQHDRDRPFMLAREFSGDGGADRNLFGVYRRHGSRNVPYRPSQVHEWLRVGLDLSEGVQAVELPSDALAQAEALLNDDLRALTLPDDCLFYYVQARPQQPVNLSAFYQGVGDTVFDALRRIPAIRGEWGFSLPEGEPERTQLDGLRVTWPGDESVSLSRSAALTAIIGQTYLTWGYERHAPPGEIWINPTALVEFTIEFWRFYFSQVVRRLDRSAPPLWRAGMRNLGGAALTKLPARPGDMFLREAHAALSDNFEVPWSTAQEGDPGSLAFEVLREVYAKFGYDETFIPYSSARTVSEEAIRSIR